MYNYLYTSNHHTQAFIMKVSELINLFENISEESMYKLHEDGTLFKNLVISQILGPKNQKHNEPFINNNLVDNIDHKRLAKNQWTPNEGLGYCPNFYRGGDDYLEKFIQTQSVEVKLSKDDKDSLIITNNDVKKFKASKTSGSFGSIHFLKDYELENDHQSADNNKLLKFKIVIKKQKRKFKFGTEVETADKCFAFNELTEFQLQRSRPDFAHSDLYLSHFYGISDNDPDSYDLFIVMKRCELILSDLIIAVHGPQCKTRNFTPAKKFPTIILKDLVFTFLNQLGMRHNDIKPENLAYVISKDNYLRGRFIDYGSKNGYGLEEPKDAEYSIFPGTILYWSPNKTPRLFIDLDELSFSDEDNMTESGNNSDDIQMTILQTTTLGALPNFKKGAGDNLWALAILILECIFGRNPATDYGVKKSEVFRCILEKEFFEDFIASKVYQDYYQNDEDFKVVEKLLKIGLTKDPEIREQEVEEGEFSKNTTRFQVSNSKLKSAIDEFTDVFRNIEVKNIRARAKLGYQTDYNDQISLDAGEIITDIDQYDEYWWAGECRGVFGNFPAECVELI